MVGGASRRALQPPDHQPETVVPVGNRVSCRLRRTSTAAAGRRPPTLVQPQNQHVFRLALPPAGEPGQGLDQQTAAVEEVRLEKRAIPASAFPRSAVLFPIRMASPGRNGVGAGHARHSETCRQPTPRPRSGSARPAAGCARAAVDGRVAEQADVARLRAADGNDRLGQDQLASGPQAGLHPDPDFAEDAPGPARSSGRCTCPGPQSPWRSGSTTIPQVCGAR